MMQWPKADADSKRASTANQALLQGWLPSLAPAIASTTTTRSAVQVHKPKALND